MPKRCEVTTKWIIDANGRKVGEVADKYALTRCDEVTWNPNVTLDSNPSPNVVNKLIECDDATYINIVADPDVVVVPGTEETI